ncbi:MAG: aldo/keto reductase, partial [Blautia sp.]|nr:aldo/keto reductase [Blautia sp.]
MLNTGDPMPQLGLGFYKMKEEEVLPILREAVLLGYRLLDTASVYKNEEPIGKAIANCGLPRSELFITSKVWNT